MAMTKIPDITFEIDGDYINLEQDTGCGEVHYVQLHKLHMRHLAELTGIVDEYPEHELPSRTGELKDVLLDLREGVEELFHFLNSVPSYPPGSATEDVLMASSLIKIADRACSILGIETGNIPLPIDKELADALSGSHASAEPIQLVITSMKGN